MRDYPSTNLPSLTTSEKNFLLEAKSEVQDESRFLSPVININDEYLEVVGPQDVLTWREAAFLASEPRPVTGSIIKTSEIEDIAYKVNGKWYNHWGEVK